MSKIVTVEVFGLPVPPENLNLPYQIRVSRDGKLYVNLEFFYAPVDRKDLVRLVGEAVLRAAEEKRT